MSSSVTRPVRIVVTALVAMMFSVTGLAGAKATEQPAFVSTWDTAKTSDGSSGSNQISLPLRSTGNYNFVVEWGDGSSSDINAWDDADKTHTYASPGTYTVSISGTIEGLAFRNGGDRLKITGISSWGPLKLGNDNGYFWGAENLQVTATDALDLTGTTDLSYAFARAGLFNNAAITTWDVSSVTSMKAMFAGHVHGTDEWTAMTFNQPIGEWDTPALTDSSWMFSGNGVFNQDLSNWDMADVTTLDGMFFSATAFNGSVNGWDTSQVTSLSSVFENATAFNKPLDQWNTSSVEVLRAAFYGATAFNQPLSTWNTSSVWHFGIAFSTAASFNQSLASWDMTSATEVDGMLNGTAMAWNNYNATLIGWSAQALPDLRDNMELGADGRKYTAAAEAARTTLVETKGWPITGDQLIESNTPGITISGALPPTTAVAASSSTTITVQSSGTGPVDIAEVSLIGLGSSDYAITSNTCPTGTLAALATCSIGLTFTPRLDGHRYTHVIVESDAADSPSLYDVSAFAYGSCSTSPFASGTGTAGDPYVIVTLAQWNCINAMNSTGQFLFLNTHAHFRLGADIDAGGRATAFQPLGTWSYEFNGHFDGDGHVLSNVVVNDTNAGVFPWLDGGANIHDLTIKDARITTLESGGVLTAGAWGSTVSNVVIDGGQVVATKGWQVGGLAGMFEGTMTEVSSSASVTSAANAEWASVGGLAGQLEGSLSRGYSTGSVTVTARAGDTVVVGGLLGGTSALVQDSLTVSPVTVSGGTVNSRVAGFVGDMWGSGSVGTSYAAGSVVATTPGVIAGFVGALRESSAVAGVLWNTQATGVATDSAPSGSSMGVTSVEMRSLATYAGWSIQAAPDVSDTWVLPAGNFAQLSWAGLSGQAADPSDNAAPVAAAPGSVSKAPSTQAPTRPATTTTSSGASAIQPVSTGVNGELSSTYRQPTVAERVTKSAILVPESVAATTVTRTMRQEASSRIGSAPTVQATVNQPVKLLVPGFTPGATYTVQFKSNAGYVVLGSVNANASGQLQIPVFRMTERTVLTIAVVSQAGSPSYVKVSAGKGSGVSATSKKPGGNVATTRR